MISLPLETPPPVFDSIEDLLADVRAGRPIILTDDEDPEGRGDLMLAAAQATTVNVNFLLKYARGLVCVPITTDHAADLGLGGMVAENRQHLRTDFTVSVDARDGITTGISSEDRARTIRLLASAHTDRDELVQPGHIFPLRAKPGGVLQRSGRTEAAVDLARLAGEDPSAVLCDILNDAGDMARLADLVRLKEEHGLKLGSIRDLIAYRRRHERLVTLEERVKLPTAHGDFDLHLFRSTIDDERHLALVKGDVTDGEPVLVRVHSECLTGDVFGSSRCDCGEQLELALARIAQEGRGVLLYLHQEGRGIGLAAKLKAYRLQDQGLDTVQANQALGFPADLRDYGFGAQVLAALGVRKIRLMTNNPRKVVGLEGHGLELVETVPIRIAANVHNRAYLQTKRIKLGHLL